MRVKYIDDPKSMKEVVNDCRNGLIPSKTDSGLDKSMQDRLEESLVALQVALCKNKQLNKLSLKDLKLKK